MTVPVTAGEIAARLAAIRANIDRACARSGRRRGEVTLVAISKTVPAALVMSAVTAGQRVFGENRVQEALEKAAACDPGVEWHLVGHLQSNKAKAAARTFALVESVDSAGIARELDRRAGEAGRRLCVLVQVKLAQEATKSGVALPEAPALIEVVAQLPHLELAGLMTIPPPPALAADSRPWFARLRELRDAWDGQRCPRGALRELSMGMSEDYEVAIEEGATLVRVGSAIFGARA
jgi:pyridoxal phosphate enzyme (YggS family)